MVAVASGFSSIQEMVLSRADIGDGHMVRFLVSDFGISWVESRNGRELVKLEGAEAIQELQRMADLAQEGQVRAMQSLAQAA